MKPFLRRLLGATLTIGSVSGLHAAVTIDPHYAATYRTFELGSAAGVPDNYGGLTFKLGDPNTMLVGGMANGPGAKVYSVAVLRDASGHITGFQGTATVFANANGVTGGIDGGLAYGPGGVLFYTSFADNRIGQIEPASTGPDKLVNLTPLGVTGSVGGLAFVPAGMPGAGRLKLVSILGNRWYDATVTPDGTGTYNITRGPGAPIHHQELTRWHRVRSVRLTAVPGRQRAHSRAPGRHHRRVRGQCQRRSDPEHAQAVRHRPAWIRRRHPRPAHR